MADVVQFRLERMVDELDDLERRGLFTRREISEIVKKRRDFEYRLKRPSPLKQDYLSYINYETQLDSLRDLRKKSIIGELRKISDDGMNEEEGEGNGETRSKKKRKMKVWEKSITDMAGVRRILEIYRLAAFRYKGDLELWFRYLEFCRERRHGRMKQVLAQAIRFHPKVPGLWIYAAAWEFDQNLNIAAARALMQSGLRVCSESEDLWIEYLRMELTYLNKLKARKIALGEDVRTLAQGSGESDGSKQWKEGNKDLFMSLNGDQEDVEGAMDERENFFWDHGSSILQTIYHGAVEALPSSMSLRKRFLEILDDVDLAHSDELKLEVMEDIKRKFSTKEDYWDWLARLQIRDADLWKDLKKEEVICKLNKAVQVYEEALNMLPSTKMFSLYAKFWLDIIAPEGEITDSLLGNHGVNSVEFISDILKVYEKAESTGCLTDDLAHQYISFYLQMGRLEEAKKLAERLCNGKHLQAASLWTLRVSIEMKWLTSKSASLSVDDFNYIFKLLIQVLPRLSVPEAEILWLTAIKTFANKKGQFEKLVQSFIILLARSGGNDNLFSVSSAIVNCVLQRDGIQRARDAYKRLLALPRPSLALFRHCIELESNLALVGESDALVNARKLYESALNIYDQNGRLWKDHYSLEMKVGTSETANAIYWRAQKTLKDTMELSALTDL